MRQFTDFISNANGYKWLDTVTPLGNYHPGTDDNKGSGNEDKGEAVCAPTDCEIVFSKFVKGWGNLLVGYMPKYGTWFRLGHNQNVLVKVGDKVKEGTKMCEIGNTGTTYAHLHKEIIIQKLPNWTMYTVGMSRGKVLEYWTDPDKWISQMIADEQKNKEELTPDIVKWAKKNKIISNWTLPYRDEDIKMAYALYKLGYSIAPASKKAMFDLEEINKDM